MNVRTLFVALLFLPISGCLTAEDDSSEGFRIATTTSMRDSGLLDVLLEEASQIYGIEVEYVAVGTGAALELGRNGDVDALIVHAPEQEEAFIEAGYGSNRTTFAWNSFVLLSPTELPETIDEAFGFVVESEQCFVSRGDDSGTHLKEQSIWRHLNETQGLPVVLDSNGLHPTGSWYYSIGQGMGAAINMAHEKECVTLSDRGTALRFQSDISLDRYEYNESVVHNPYSFLSIQGGDEIKANLLLTYLLNEGQSTIANYTMSGEAAFFIYE